MRIHEAAALVEREGLPARMNCQVFQFQYAVPLISNHSYGYGCCCLILHDEHFAPLQISVNHGFLFIPK